MSSAEDSEAIEAESEKITGRIDELFDKLANKLRRKAEKAKDKIESVKSPTKRAVLLRRFELYADAAHHLESRLTDRREAPDAISD